jgi:hypothetical protein
MGFSAGAQFEFGGTTPASAVSTRRAVVGVVDRGTTPAHEPGTLVESAARGPSRCVSAAQPAPSSPHSWAATQDPERPMRLARNLTDEEYRDVIEA